MSTKHENEGPSPEDRERWMDSLSVARIETAAAAAANRRAAERYRRHADATEGTAAQAWVSMAEGETAIATRSEQAVEDLRALEDHLLRNGWT